MSYNGFTESQLSKDKDILEEYSPMPRVITLTALGAESESRPRQEQDQSHPHETLHYSFYRVVV